MALLNVQQLLDRLREETIHLESNIVHILYCINNDNFLSEQDSKNTINNLIEIGRIQEECKAEYLSLMEIAELPDNIRKIQEDLLKKQKVLSVTSKYEQALNVFFMLHSKNEACEVQLEKCKQEIIADNIEDMSPEECQEKFGRYVDFIEAYKEADPYKLVEYVQKLTPHFGNELITCVVFTKNLYETTEDEKTLIEIASSQEVSVETAEITIAIEEFSEITTDVVTETDSQFAVNVGVEESCDKDDEDNFWIMHDLCVRILEKNKLSEIHTKNEDKVFGVKVFKNDVNSANISIRIGIINCVFESDCATAEFIQNRILQDIEAIVRECTYLVNRGYLKEYSLNGLDNIYCVSKRGLKAFSTKDSASFLQFNTQKVKNELYLNSPAEAIIRILRMKALIREGSLKKSGSRIDKDFMCSGAFITAIGTEKEQIRIYTGIISDNADEYRKYINEITEYIADKRNLYVYIMGYDFAQAEQLIPIFDAAFGEKEIYSYGLVENSWSDNEFSKVTAEATTMKAVVETVGINGKCKVEKTEVLGSDTVKSNVSDLCELNPSDISKETNSKVSEELSDEKMEDALEEENVEVISVPFAEAKSEKKAEGITFKTDMERTSVQNIVSDAENSFMEEIPHEQIIDIYQTMICQDKMYCATAYLRAASFYDKKLLPIYQKLAYAVNDPLEKCSYTSDSIMNIYFFDADTVAYDYFKVAALLRNYFMDHIRYDYSMTQLQSFTKSSNVLSEDNCLNKVAYELFKFKSDVHSGIDKYADYRVRDNKIRESKLEETRNEAKEQYNAYILGQSFERGSHKRFLETQKLIFSKDSDLGVYLKFVVENDKNMLDFVKEYLQETFIRAEALIDPINIDSEKINAFINHFWEEAGQFLLIVRKTSDLMGSYRTNLYKRVHKIVKVLCDWVALMESSNIKETDTGFINYKKIRNVLIENMDKAIKTIHEELVFICEKEEIVGRKVLLYTLVELKSRLSGDYSDAQNKYFYLGFLKNTKILLTEDYLPDVASRIRELDDFSAMKRIVYHSQEEETDVSQRLQDIFDGDDDYGTAELLLAYVKNEGIDVDLNRFPSIEDSIVYAKKAAKEKKDGFIENLELAQSYGQIDNTLEDKKEKILQSVNEWYEHSVISNNFGFFVTILTAFHEKIKKEAKSREESIKKELQNYCDIHTELLNEVSTKVRLSKIQSMIEQQNYTVAEDLINRLANDELESEIELLQNDYLRQFMDSYDYNYKSVNDAGIMLRSMFTTNFRANKDTKGGKRLVDHWLTSGRLGEQKLMILLDTMGFQVGQVKEQTKISGKIETYNVMLKKAESGRKSNYKHPIAAFGSRASEEGFRVVCLYGKYDAGSLLDTFREVGNTKHTIVLLDYSLPITERRRLARKVKADVPEKIFGVIDRVVLMYLINNYSETSVNRMLMAVMMPYSYYQPYVVKSADIMPPEIFIGRKEELSKIESASGVNIVYGGRQLGKSALLRMAKTAVNFNENGDRAVLVDIKGLDYKGAAKKIAHALSDEGIFHREVDTVDWDELAREIKRRLSSTENKIPYFLLLMDEADAFIESCEKVEFHPFDVLKDIQGIGQGRFKFVVAGLRNIVRFKRNIALGNNSVLTHLSSITVKPFNVMEAKELLEIPLFYLGLRFPKEKDSLVSMILATANYFPGLLQLYCAKLLEAMKKSDYAGYNESETPPYEVQEKHIKKVLSESGFQQQIREKFMITLKADEDDYYYIIALLTAYLYHTDSNTNGYTPEDIITLGKELKVEKIKNLSIDRVEALMEEMKELNVLRITAQYRYLFTRYSFFQIMGTTQQIEEDILNYMGE